MTLNWSCVPYFLFDNTLIFLWDFFLKKFLFQSLHLCGHPSDFCVIQSSQYISWVFVWGCRIIKQSAYNDSPSSANNFIMCYNVLRKFSICDSLSSRLLKITVYIDICWVYDSLSVKYCTLYYCYRKTVNLCECRRKSNQIKSNKNLDYFD